MSWYITKVVITALLIVLISEISKISSMIGAILASIPLVSVLAMMWLYIDTKDVERISQLSVSIFWLVIPSLILFISLPLLLKNGVSFYPGMAIAISLTVAGYFLMIAVLGFFGITL